ncbi:MAG: prephenate dehydrogenase [Lachnospira sp.]
MDFKAGFIGFGLIAGSMAHALKESDNNYTIVATSRHLEPVFKAKEDKIVDIVTEGITSEYEDCDFIIICTPVITISDYLKKLSHIVNDKCIITDVGSVKSSIHHTVSELGMDSVFIGGHPMAGSELTGYDNSSSSIIKNCRYVITPTDKTTSQQLNRFKDFVLDLNANPIVMDYEIHDKAVAAISHLPHLISTALVHLVSEHDDEQKHMQMLAAGSFRDMTRVAASSPEMWDQICSTNSEAISSLLEDYINTLQDIKDNIDNKTPGYIAGLFEMSKEYRNSFIHNTKK